MPISLDKVLPVEMWGIMAGVFILLFTVKLMLEIKRLMRGGGDVNYQDLLTALDDLRKSVSVDRENLARLTAQVKHIETRNERADREHECFREVFARLAAIETNISYIKERLK